MDFSSAISFVKSSGNPKVSYSLKISTPGISVASRLLEAGDDSFEPIESDSDHGSKALFLRLDYAHDVAPSADQIRIGLLHVIRDET